MKRLGDELGSLELWDKKKFDVMYKLLKMKFEQNDVYMMNLYLNEVLDFTPLQQGVWELTAAHAGLHVYTKGKVGTHYCPCWILRLQEGGSTPTIMT